MAGAAGYPQNRAFVDEILKTLASAITTPKGIIDVCKGLSLNDSYWVVPEGFEGKFSQYNLYENRFSEILALVAYTGAGGSRQAFTTPRADHRRYAAQGVALCGARWDLSLKGRHDRRVQYGPGAVLRVLCFADCGNHASERRAL